MDLDLHLIGGSGSSGTTLLAHVLHGLHDIRSGPEMGAFHHRDLYQSETDAFRRSLYRCLAGQGRRIGLTVNRLDLPLVPAVFFMARDYYGVEDIEAEFTMFESANDLRDLLCWIKTRMSESDHFPEQFLWLDQTPKNAIAAREFLETFPGSRFIHLIRDGRDVMLSLAKRYSHEAPGHDQSTYLMVGMARWVYDVTQARRARGLPGYLEVRYEDFVQSPLPETNAILEHLGRPPVTQADLDESLTQNRATGDALMGGAKPTWGNQPGQAITAKSVGRWRTALGPELIARLRRFEFRMEDEADPFHFGHMLDDLGYA